MKTINRIFQIASSVFSQLAIAMRHFAWGISSLYPKQTIVLGTKQGIFKTARNAYDPISTSLFVKNNFELDLMEKYHKVAEQLNLKTSGTLLDIGANIGVICVGMLRNFNFDRAIAIEPEPNNIKWMKYNVDKNGLSERIKIIHSAASDSKSFLEMELSKENCGDHRIRIDHNQKENELLNESNRKTIKIPSDSIDNILRSIDAQKNDISLIWIDVQGFEGYVFKGAKGLLSQHIPTVSEIWPYGIKRAGMSKEDFCQIIEEVGWTHYWAERKGRFIKYPIDLFSYYYDELDYKTYGGNVIFTS